jgi:dTDP-4-amino-4,6-dideoxygalactose transaminase
LKGQLDVLSEIKEKKRKVFDLYKSLLSKVDGVVGQKEDPRTVHSGWMFGVRVEGGDFTEMQNHFNENFIDVRPMFYTVSAHKHLRHLKIHGGESVAKKINKECVILPSYPDLKDHEIAHVVNTLKNYVGKL